MSEYLKLDIKGFETELPILPLPSGINIAFFNLHGDASLTEHCGKRTCEISFGLRRTYNRRIERASTYARLRERTRAQILRRREKV